jgi:pyruvate,orthophosphate dikinase
MEFYPFGLHKPVTETSAEILGGKGAGLVWMDQQGVPVPPGFVIPVTVWAEYDKKPKITMKAIKKELKPYLDALIGHFGYLPLLSVRSGSRVSCPGMMDTILNVGLDADSDVFWMNKLGKECYSNSLHRLITMYGSVVNGLDRMELEHGDYVDALEFYSKNLDGLKFPDAEGQLLGSIEAVFKSWDNGRAKTYRKEMNIPREWGTAVTVQAMVFGNYSNKSGTGVLFTRNPDTGVAKVTGEFLINAQGEDVVAGIRTPMPLEEMSAWNDAVCTELYDTVLKLEKLRGDVQDVEFTIQEGKLYLLQTRNAKRSAAAAIRIALDMVKEGLISKQVAVKRVSAKQYDLAQLAKIDPSWKKKPAFIGKPACSGVVSGVPVFSAADAISCKEPCILITEETTPDDIGGMYAAKGVITMTGGATSHAAVVARGADKPCITGVGASLEAFQETKVVSMEGSTGYIWLEEVKIQSGEHNGDISEFAALVSEVTGTLPVIFHAPSKPMKEALLYLGDKMINPSEAAKVVAQASVKVEKLYLDLMIPVDGAEADFFSICASYNPVQKLVGALYDLLSSTSAYPHLQDRLYLLGNCNPGNFKTVGVGSDLRSLILAKEDILLGSLPENDAAFNKVLEWKKAENLSMLSAGKKVLGIKSLVSLPQALQLIAEGGI